ncbi:unnamed protein product [Ectocarpus sp. 12 AP-2014]
MRAVVERGANVEALDDDQNTPLHLAAFFNRVEAIDLLLEAGANIEARDDSDSTPLHCAVLECHLETMSALLKHGAHVNAQNNNRSTPLHRAAFHAGTDRFTEVVDPLLRSGADETILDVDGKTAADIVGDDVQQEYQLADDVERVRELLANASADRAWRRRGHLVLCGAHPGRMQQVRARSNACAGVANLTRSRAKMGRTEAIGCGGGVEASPVDKRTIGGGHIPESWGSCAAKTKNEEGVPGKRLHYNRQRKSSKNKRPPSFSWRRFRRGSLLHTPPLLRTPLPH